MFSGRCSPFSVFLSLLLFICVCVSLSLSFFSSSLCVSLSPPFSLSSSSLVDIIIFLPTYLPISLLTYPSSTNLTKYERSMCIGHDWRGSCVRAGGGAGDENY